MVESRAIAGQQTGKVIKYTCDWQTAAPFRNVNAGILECDVIVINSFTMSRLTPEAVPAHMGSTGI